MTLKTRFKFMSLVSIVASFIIASTFTLLLVRMSTFVRQQKITDEIGFLLVNSNLFGQENIVRHNERTRQQWWAANRSLEKILKTSKDVFRSPSSQKVLARMQGRVAFSADIFRLIENQQNQPPTPTVVEREFVLSRQLSLLATVLIVDANELNTLLREDTTASLHTLIFFTSLAVLAIFLLAIWRTFVIDRSVLKPIQALEKATAQLTVGAFHTDLPEHNQDEIGQLASSFNEMNRTIQKTQASLRSMHRALETKVEQRTSELRQKSLALEKSNAELMRFVYVASHDLQEPLRVMVNYLQLLEAAKAEHNLDSAQHYIDIAVRQGFRMKELIQALLEYTAVEASNARLEAVPAVAALEVALSNLQTPILETGAQVAIDPLPEVMADRRLLTQVFQNLIGNALKYRSERPPQLRVSARHDQDEWIFSVSDNGIGIDPAHHRKIFEMFQRLHGRTQYAGTGIGLSICQKIIEHQGGRIWVESKEGEGSTFYFTLKETPE
jgi:signal transduction histidine kinase